jgi:hypothetical protein
MHRANRSGTWPVVGGLLLALGGALAGQPPADPVEALRVAVEDRNGGPLEALAAAVTRIGDLRRAVALGGPSEEGPREQQWQQLRAGLAKRLAEALRAELRRDDPTARRAAVVALGELAGDREPKLPGAPGKPAERPLRGLAGDLVPLLGSGNPTEVRRAALRAYLLLNDPPDAIRFLDKPLAAPDAADRRLAAEGLTAVAGHAAEAVDRRSSSGPTAEEVGAFRPLLALAGRAIGDADPQVRRHGLEAVRLATRPLPHEPLVSDRFLRGRVTSLGPLVEGLAGVVPAVVGALGDADAEVARAAGKALAALATGRRGLLGSRAEPSEDLLRGPLAGAVPELAKRLANGTGTDRLTALDALEDLESLSAPAVDALVAALTD